MDFRRLDSLYPGWVGYWHRRCRQDAGGNLRAVLPVEEDCLPQVFNCRLAAKLQHRAFHRLQAERWANQRRKEEIEDVGSEARLKHLHPIRRNQFALQNALLHHLTHPEPQGTEVLLRQQRQCIFLAPNKIQTHPIVLQLG